MPVEVIAHFFRFLIKFDAFKADNERQGDYGGNERHVQQCQNGHCIRAFTARAKGRRLLVSWCLRPKGIWHANG